MEFRVRLAQISPLLGDVPANLERHLAIINEAERGEIDLVVFPEMSLCGYHVRDLAAEVARVESAPELGALAAATAKTSAVVGYVAQSPRYDLHVSAGYFEAGELVHVHNKVYLPTYGMFDEQRYFANGHSVRAFKSRLASMGMLICEDVWHISTPYILAHDGAQVIVIIANSPARGPRDGSWDTAEAYEAMLRTYAEMSGSYIVFANRVGYEEGVHFWGGSRVIAPNGAEIARGPMGEEALVDATIDLESVRLARISTPLLADENLDLTIRELERIRHERTGY